MLSKTQAEDIGDALVDQEITAKHAAAKPIPLIYRCAELHPYERWQQQELLQQAKQLESKPALRRRLIGVAWQIVCLWIWLAVSAPSERTLYLPLLLLASIGVPLLAYVLLIRAQVKRLAVQLGLETIQRRAKESDQGKVSLVDSETLEARVQDLFR
jgi:hypothetical protein